MGTETVLAYTSNLKHVIAYRQFGLITGHRTPPLKDITPRRKTPWKDILYDAPKHTNLMDGMRKRMASVSNKGTSLNRSGVSEEPGEV